MEARYQEIAPGAQKKIRGVSAKTPLPILKNVCWQYAENVVIMDRE